MKQILNKISISMTALLVIGSILTACSSTEKVAVENKGAASGTEPTSASNEKTVAENKSANKDSAMTQDGLPELKKGDDYKGVREKMLKAGWKPAGSSSADWCGSAETTCDEFEEYESKTDKNLTNFRWKKGSKFVEISCLDTSSLTFESYKIESNSTTIAQTERWDKFWNEFKNAVNKKDKEKLNLLMTKNIDGSGAPETREERIAAIESSDMWASMQKTISEGAITGKCDKPCRITKDGYLIFTYDMASWKWSGLGGEGGE